MNATDSQIDSTDFLYSVNLWQKFIIRSTLRGILSIKNQKAMHFSYAGNSIRIQLGDQIQ